MVIDIDKLAQTMNRQLTAYKELAGHYKLLNQGHMATAFESLYMAFSKINTSYVQIQKMVNEVFKPMNKQLYFELVMIDSKLQEIKTVKSQLSVAEKKLKEKKTVLFDQQDITKWELSTDCSVPMDTLFTNRAVAFREMLPKETKDCGKLRMLYGYLCNKMTEEFTRINSKNKDQMSINILFTSKINGDSAREVPSPYSIS